MALAVSVLDLDHSGEEERWATLGTAVDGSTIVVNHTFREETSRRVRVRLISARRATRRERDSYEESR
jgi:uncharacterized DUF497 family protein